MPKTFSELKEKADLVFRQTKTIHVDVMNGSITHSVSWPFIGDGLAELEKIKTGELALPYWKEIDYEVDIMMENPEESLAEWVNAGFHRIILHFENVKKFSSIINEYKGVVELGVAVGVETPNDEVYKCIDDGMDFLQFMGIYQIGFQGNPFDARVLEKIKTAREVYPNIPISADGSVNLETAPKLVAAGANRLVIGSAIFKAKDMSSNDTDIAAFGSFDVGNNIDISGMFEKKEKGPAEALKEFKKLVA
jgi:ribulose-phosphate 3-epimerase